MENKRKKKIEKKINIDLAIIASQSSERQFMTTDQLISWWILKVSRAP